MSTVKKLLSNLIINFIDDLFVSLGLSKICPDDALIMHYKRTDRHGFPLTVTNWAYCLKFYSFRHNKINGKLSREEFQALRLPLDGKFMFNCYKVGFDNVLGTSEHLVDGLIPAMRIGDRVGLYEVTDEYKLDNRSYSDLAGWDNGLSVDLKLVNVIEVDKVL